MRNYHRDTQHHLENVPEYESISTYDGTKSTRLSLSWTRACIDRLWVLQCTIVEEEKEESQTMAHKGTRGFKGYTLDFSL